MSELSVIEALHQSRGKPGLGKVVSFEGIHTCGNCHHQADTARANKVLTSQFGSWDDIVPDPDGVRWLCLPCGWAFRDPELRRNTILVTPHTDTIIPLHELRHVLAHPITHNQSIIMPIGGKRPVAPRATWGTIVTDHSNIQWTPRHWAMLKAMIHLRELGFTEAGLREDSPTFSVLVDLPLEIHQQVKDEWRRLDVLRRDKTLMPMFLFASRKKKP